MCDQVRVLSRLVRTHGQNWPTLRAPGTAGATLPKVWGRPFSQTSQTQGRWLIPSQARRIG